MYRSSLPWCRRIVVPLLVFVALGLLLLAQGFQHEDARAATRQLTFVTGGVGGPYHVIGSGLAELWNRAIPGINVSVTATAASVVNLRMISGGRADIAFTQSDIAFFAYRGLEMFQSPLRNIRLLTEMHTNYVQIATLRDSPIQSVADLRGKRVGVGAPGSGTEANTRAVLAAYGIQYRDLAKPDFLSYAETAQQLSNRNIDAGFMTGGLPVAAMTELATTRPIRLLPVDPSVIAKLRQDFPMYIEGTIPAGTYPGQTEPVRTVAMKNYLVVPAEMDDELAYRLVKTLYDNIEQVRTFHNAVSSLDIKTAVETLAIPLHPGAERYFREKGLIK